MNEATRKDPLSRDSMGKIIFLAIMLIITVILFINYMVYSTARLDVCHDEIAKYQKEMQNETVSIYYYVDGGCDKIIFGNGKKGFACDSGAVWR
jgi:hypothetical protein